MKGELWRAGFCGGFMAQWFMAALVRHPGFESRSCQFSLFSFFSQQAEFHLTVVTFKVVTPCNICTPVSVHLYLYTSICTLVSVHQYLYTSVCTPVSVHQCLYTSIGTQFPGPNVPLSREVPLYSSQSHM